MCIRDRYNTVNGEYNDAIDWKCKYDNTVNRKYRYGHTNDRCV